MLMRRSRSVVGFWLVDCFRRPGMVQTALDELFAMTLDGRLRPVLGGVYPLADARRAHEDLLARRTTGKLVLDPSR
jgi:NADPH2:quinone reductase